MAQWTETLEPYIKVTERVKTMALNPTVGEDLIIGVVLISDAGPSTPTLISGQPALMEYFASQEMSEKYIKSLNNLYLGDNKDLAATMWANAYRLAGSNTLLVSRAIKASGIYFSKPLSTSTSTSGDYILRDGNLLKKVEKFWLVLDSSAATNPGNDNYGWNIAINGVGVFGNRMTDEGSRYDYYVSNLPELVDQLNDVSTFYAPDVEYYTSLDAHDGEDGTTATRVTGEITDAIAGNISAVYFKEVYLGADFLDKTNIFTLKGATNNGYINIIPKTDNEGQPSSTTADLNGSAFSGFTAPNYYAMNANNSASTLKVRIRRFNHDVVISKTLAEQTDLTANGESPWIVLSDLNKETSDHGKDFYEVAILDPTISKAVSFFNLGSVSGLGDMEVSELNDMLKMIKLQLPDDLDNLGLDYYKKNPTTADADTIFADLTINTASSKIISVSDADLKKALDRIVEDEVYITEGLSDLGNTEPSFQNYMANTAVNDNYYYPMSTVNSTNYMVIGNSSNKISQDSYKLYMSAPWDIDTGTIGWKYYASPSVIYWEGVARNRRNNEEFASNLGQDYGVRMYQRPTCEFNRKQRQLLLSKKINTVSWNISTQAWNMNDNYTKQSQDNILMDDGNARLHTHISKCIPALLRQFIGKKITEKLCDNIYGVIDYWFKTAILSLGVTVDAYQIFVPYDEALARQSKVRIVVNCRYQRALKFIDVINNAFDLGMDINSME